MDWGTAMKLAFKTALLAGGIALLAACGSETGAGPGGADGGAAASGDAAIASVAGMPEGPLRVADADLVALYKQLHAAPELSFKESATSALLAAELKSPRGRGLRRCWRLRER
jgi:hippurate hydrolase